MANAECSIIAVGASAGGLEAFTSFLRVFPPQSGMAIIFVQHLDPAHESMIPRLLAPHTKMTVRQAINGAKIEANHVYIIAPGTYLGIHDGKLVSQPKERDGTRMPFDFLLESLAQSCGEHGMGVVLSGYGTDGCIGLQSLKERGGLVIAQNPEEAAHPGMPQSAIDKGIVDLILSIEKMPPSLMAYAEQLRMADDREQSGGFSAAGPELSQILDILIARAEQDFSAYKRGTLMRRIARRMAVHAISKIDLYLEMLLNDPNEIDILAKDLLIHVTGFFRDAQVFEHLATHVIPQLVTQSATNQTLRVWVPACSSGEEVYSLAILFLEAIAAAKKNTKLQIFGSDIDVDAVSSARAGKYSAAIKDHISVERLNRFFIETVDGYRIAPILRESAIFTVQDVLSDPPFARLDFVSCRNLLIYLLPEAQQQVLSLLHFALRHGGLLLLGIAENVGALRGDFEALSENLRIFRRIGNSRKIRPQLGFNSQPRAFWPRPIQVAAQRAPNIGDFSQRMLLESYAPASVVINDKDEGVYYFGSTDQYLQIPSGDASHGLYAVARQGLRTKLRTALNRARNEKGFVALSGGSVLRGETEIPVRLEVRPVRSDEKEYLLVSFIDEFLPTASAASSHGGSHDTATSAELERALEALQKELRDTARELEDSSADQEAINEEAQSLNEEYQSTNEELETSKEELQSLNEELTALNVQLTATVNQQRNTANDLDNILLSSELSIIFLDLDLNIKFFSPAAKALLNAIDSDIGRPIHDLAHRFDDNDLTISVQAVLKKLTTISREVRAYNGAWYMRRILPYRTLSGVAQGVIITFDNISAMKAAEQKIEAARAYTDSVLDTVRQPQVVIDERLRIVSSNNSFRLAFSMYQEVLVGQTLTSIGNGQLDIPAVNAFLDRARAESTPIEDYELEIDVPAIGKRVLLLSSRRILSDMSDGQKFLVAIDDITERKVIAATLEIAKSKAEKANLGKSRFLAAASHDLRQPLQTLSLLHGILARKVTEPESLTLIGKLDETLGAMSGMLDTLLDINQLEAGTVQPEIDNFDVMTILEQLKSEFGYLTKSKGLSLHVVASTIRVRSDPLLLSQMIRNLLSNAIKYTKRGKVLIGCRHSNGKVRIEVWDTGIGIPSGQHKAIFEEYHQLGNPARERGLGLGLGLSIVQRIGELLGHRIEVRSEAGKGSVFIIEVPRGSKALRSQKAIRGIDKTEKPASRTGTILIIEDDPTVRGALELVFNSEGYHTIVAADGIEVAALVQGGTLMPDAIVADYNLPGGRTGLEVITQLRQTLNSQIPAIVLTGDIATDVLRKVVSADCGYLHKPVNVDQLTQRIGELLTYSRRLKIRSLVPAPVEIEQSGSSALTIFIVDDDVTLLESMRDMLQQRGHRVAIHASAAAFLAAYQPHQKGCLIVDSIMPGMTGLELLKRLSDENRSLPSIVITGYGDISMAIKSMKAGAIDFIEKPARQDELLASIARALTQVGDTAQRTNEQEAAAATIASLTPREREVLELVVDGLPNKQIAFELKISQRTVETHRAAVMKRTNTASLPDLIRLVMRAG